MECDLQLGAVNWQVIPRSLLQGQPGTGSAGGAEGAGRTGRHWEKTIPPEGNSWGEPAQGTAGDTIPKKPPVQRVIPVENLPRDVLETPFPKKHPSKGDSCGQSPRRSAGVTFPKKTPLQRVIPLENQPREQLESPSLELLKSVWMWLLRTWFSGEFLSLVILKVFSNLNNSMR